MNISDELANDIWGDLVAGCFEDRTIEEAVMDWLELYKDMRPWLLGSEDKRKVIFRIIEKNNFLPRIEMMKEASSETFVTNLESLLDALESAIRDKR